MILRKLKLQEHFSCSEKAIAEYLLHHAMDIAKMNIRDLAEQTYTSPSTIIRFCRKLGTSGYAAFKIQFLSEYKGSLNDYSEVNEDRPFHHEDSMEQTAANIARVSILGIEETLQLFPFHQMDDIISHMMKASSIAIYGEGSSIAPAYEFKSKMVRLGIPVQLEESITNQKYLAVTSSPKHVAILISYSGESSSVIAMARILRNRQACTIAITSEGDNTLASLCQYKISTGSSENKRLLEKIEKFSSHTSVQFVLNCLFSFIYHANYEYNRKHASENEKYLLQFIK